jgi:hypothetical protein
LRCMIDSLQGKNVNEEQFKSLDNMLKDMGWEFNFNNAPTGSAAVPLALMDGKVAPEELSDEVWHKLDLIISKLASVESEG